MINFFLPDPEPNFQGYQLKSVHGDVYCLPPPPCRTVFFERYGLQYLFWRRLMQKQDTIKLELSKEIEKILLFVPPAVLRLFSVVSAWYFIIIIIFATVIRAQNSIFILLEIAFKLITTFGVHKNFRV